MSSPPSLHTLVARASGQDTGPIRIGEREQEALRQLQIVCRALEQGLVRIRRGDVEVERLGHEILFFADLTLRVVK